MSDFSSILSDFEESSNGEPLPTHDGVGVSIWRRVKQTMMDVFLPKGYPHSVSEDYLRCQTFNCAQTIFGCFSTGLGTAALLKGAGVGSQNASLMAAVLTWFLQDGVESIGCIVVAWMFGSKLDPYWRFWRLSADFAFDCCNAITLTAPLWSYGMFMGTQCVAAAITAVTSVAGSATRITVKRHQAIAENLAEVCSKSESQSTMVNIVALFVNMALLAAVDGRLWLSWILFAFFCPLHLFFNYMEVRSVNMGTLTRQGLAMCVKGFCASEMPSLVKVNRTEPIFRSPGPQRRFGCSLKHFKKIIPDSFYQPEHGRWFASCAPKGNVLQIALRNDSTIVDQLEAAMTVELRAISDKWPSEVQMEALKNALQQNGWTLSAHHLDFDDFRFWPKCEGRKTPTKSPKKTLDVQCDEQEMSRLLSFCQ